MPSEQHEGPNLPSRLTAFDLFAGMASADLEKIAPRLHVQTWPRRQAVMPPASTAENFYLILKGRVKIGTNHPVTGRELTFCILGPGAGHDIITLLDGHIHRVNATSLDALETACAPLSQWHTWMERYPSLRHALLHCAARRLRELSELAEDLALHETSARLAHLLLRHIDEGSDDERHLLHGLAHEELAHLIGSVRVVVNRLINRFKQEGIIHTEAGQLHVTDFERLMEKAERRVQSLLKPR
jgi:CRP/FNR family transcriptional regulator, cyclic AMP receptor protein